MSKPSKQSKQRIAHQANKLAKYAFLSRLWPPSMKAVRMRRGDEKRRARRRAQKGFFSLVKIKICKS